MPGLVSVDEVVADLAVGDRLDGDRDAAVGARAVGERVGAPLADAVDVDADPDVLAGHVAGPVLARADHQGGGVGGLGLDRHDPAAQVGAPAQRVDQVEEVGGHQRGERCLGHAAQAVAKGSRRPRRRGPYEEIAHDFILSARTSKVMTTQRERLRHICSERTICP